MFGIGGLEFLIILIAAIVFIGPKDLPKVLYALGKGAGKLRRISQDISEGLENFTKDAELDDIIAEANKAGDADMAFRIEQQEALEEQKKKAQKQTDKKPPRKTSKAKLVKKKTTKTSKTKKKKDKT